MSDFTYAPPDPAAFMHTLRRYFQEQSHDDIAALLIGATCQFNDSSSYSQRRWNAYYTTFRLTVPIARLAKFTEPMKERVLMAVQALMPDEVGFDVLAITVSPIIETPPDEDAPLGNEATLAQTPIHLHDGLRFRSKTETRVYDALKKRSVLFFANATAIMGAKNAKREPDFLVCQDGKWGMLEVMGEQFHTNAVKDHDRARLFDDYGLTCIHFYPADRCYSAPDAVVDDFLSRLSKSR